MNLSLCLFPKSYVSVCSSSLNNYAYMIGRLAAVLFGAACRISLKQPVELLCTFNQAFISSISLKPKYSSQREVLTWLWVSEELPFFLFGRSDFYMVDNVSIYYVHVDISFSWRDISTEVM